MMRHFLILLLIVLSADLLGAQAPAIKWQKTYGGSLDDKVSSIWQTTDGGYIVAGETQSTDGEVTGNHGSSDVWLVKLNDTGAVEWQKCLGGSSLDYAQYIRQTADGGFIIAGGSQSDDGDVSGNHGGFYDVWIVKINDTGSIKWQKCLGGSGSDASTCMQPTFDNGYIIGGNSDSHDGDVSGNYGNSDCWVVKINDTGAIVWQKHFGGSGNDILQSIYPTADGGYIAAGATESDDDDVSGNHGSYDYWIVKLDDTGALIWQKCLGGSMDEAASSIVPLSTGGFLAVGQTQSNDSEVSGNHGNYDIWIAKLTDAGDLDWQKCLGGSYAEFGFAAQETADGGYLICGASSSTDGDVSGSHGNGDGWLLRLNAAGTIIWQKCLGGTGTDEIRSMQQTSDNGYILAAWSTSADGDVTSNHGDNDYWVIKLAPDTATIAAEMHAAGAGISIHPNPANNLIQIDAPLSFVSDLVSITGTVIGQKTANKMLDISSLPAGVYFLNVYDQHGARVKTEKLIKE